MQMRILVIEDDQQSRDYILAALACDGHDTQEAHDGETGLRMACDGSYDVLVVDRMLPRLDGLSLVRELRKSGVQTPALFLTALGSAEDRVAGLTGGGDDYLVKPFCFEELTARLNLLGRRAAAPRGGVLVCRGLIVDRLRRRTTRDGTPIDLKPLEFKLLEHFMLNPDRVFTRMMLLEQIWGFKFDPQTNIVETHMSRLRAKIDLPDQPPIIATVRGAGYCLRAA
ncbi:MAG: DNA-binding response regulator [Caulobacteraceae bacterium]|nr:DNA-binding response regulator [Caulobacteraceae bacterium]